MSAAINTRAAAINAKCRECIVDDKSAGTWREQVACCSGPNCALFSFRPLPRQCIVDGAHDLAAIAAVRAKVDRGNRTVARSRR